MKTIIEIQMEFRSAAPEQLPALLTEYAGDERAGIRKLCDSAQRRIRDHLAELARTEELCRYEKEYERFGAVCGIDEVGRGPLAGPVMAGAVILPAGCRLLHINDSKKLSAKKREELYDILREQAVSFAFGIVDAKRIDEINILQATYEAMRQAIEHLSVRPSVLLNDAVTIPQVGIRQVPIIKGDAKSISIGAASIMAKVTRDRMMVEYDKLYPGYGFAENKGYGSAEHLDALKRLGPCPIHRRSFLKNLTGAEDGEGSYGGSEIRVSFHE